MRLKTTVTDLEIHTVIFTSTHYWSFNKQILLIIESWD